jgi:general secretion pathway protein L
MPHKLLIRLKNNVDETYLMDWALLDDHAHIQQSSWDADHEAFKAIVKTIHKIIVLVPGEDVFLTKVKLPKLSPSRLAKAIPYALEDQLTEDASLLHFAVSKRKGDAPLTVAIVNKNKMKSWQAYLVLILKEAYSSVTVFLPDVLALPLTADTFYILIDQHLALVKTSVSTGFVIEKEVLFQMLQLTLKKRDLPKINLIHIAAPEETKVLTDEEEMQLAIPLSRSLAPPHTLSLMTMEEESYPINLLQGEFTPEHKMVTFEELTRYAVMLAGAWLVILTLAYLVNYIILYREKNAFTVEVARLYHLIYPAKVLPPDPKKSLQNELTRLQAGRTDNTFVRLIKLITPDILPLIKTGSSVKSLTFINNQLILDYETNDLSLLDKLRQNLEKLGLKVVVSNEERRAGGLVAARLTLEEMP